MKRSFDEMQGQDVTQEDSNNEVNQQPKTKKQKLSGSNIEENNTNVMFVEEDSYQEVVEESNTNVMNVEKYTSEEVAEKGYNNQTELEKTNENQEDNQASTEPNNTPIQNVKLTFIKKFESEINELNEIIKINSEKQEFFNSLFEKIKILILTNESIYDVTKKLISLTNECLDLYNNQQINKLDIFHWRKVFTTLNSLHSAYFYKQIDNKYSSEEKNSIDDEIKKISCESKKVFNDLLEKIKLIAHYENEVINSDDKKRLEFIKKNISLLLIKKTHYYAFKNSDTTEFFDYLKAIYNDPYFKNINFTHDYGVIYNVWNKILKTEQYSAIRDKIYEGKFNDEVIKLYFNNNELDSMFFSKFRALKELKNKNIIFNESELTWFVCQKVINNSKYSKITITELLNTIKLNCSPEVLLDSIRQATLVLNFWYVNNNSNVNNHLDLYKELEPFLKELIQKNSNDFNYFSAPVAALIKLGKPINEIIEIIKEKNWKNPDVNYFGSYPNSILNVALKFSFDSELLKLICPNQNDNLLKFILSNTDVKFKIENNKVVNILSKEGKWLKHDNVLNTPEIEGIEKHRVKIIKDIYGVEYYIRCLNFIKNITIEDHNRHNNIVNYYQKEFLNLLNVYNYNDITWILKINDNNEFRFKLNNLLTKINSYILYIKDNHNADETKQLANNCLNDARLKLWMNDPQFIKQGNDYFNNIDLNGDIKGTILEKSLLELRKLIADIHSNALTEGNQNQSKPIEVIKNLIDKQIVDLKNDKDARKKIGANLKLLIVFDKLVTAARPNDVFISGFKIKFYNIIKDICNNNNWLYDLSEDKKNELNSLINSLFDYFKGQNITIQQDIIELYNSNDYEYLYKKYIKYNEAETYNTYRFFIRKCESLVLNTPANQAVQPVLNPHVNQVVQAAPNNVNLGPIPLGPIPIAPKKAAPAVKPKGNPIMVAPPKVPQPTPPKVSVTVPSHPKMPPAPAGFKGMTASFPKGIPVGRPVSVPAPAQPGAPKKLALPLAQPQQAPNVNVQTVPVQAQRDLSLIKSSNLVFVKSLVDGAIKHTIVVQPYFYQRQTNSTDHPGDMGISGKASKVLRNIIKLIDFVMFIDNMDKNSLSAELKNKLTSESDEIKDKLINYIRTYGDLLTGNDTTTVHPDFYFDLEMYNSDLVKFYNLNLNKNEELSSELNKQIINILYCQGSYINYNCTNSNNKNIFTLSDDFVIKFKTFFKVLEKHLENKALQNTNVNSQVVNATTQTVMVPVHQADGATKVVPVAFPINQVPPINVSENNNNNGAVVNVPAAAPKKGAATQIQPMPMPVVNVKKAFSIEKVGNVERIVESENFYKRTIIYPNHIPSIKCTLLTILVTASLIHNANKHKLELDDIKEDIIGYIRKYNDIFIGSSLGTINHEFREEVDKLNSKLINKIKDYKSNLSSINLDEKLMLEGFMNSLIERQNNSLSFMSDGNNYTLLDTNSYYMVTSLINSLNKHLENKALQNTNVESQPDVVVTGGVGPSIVVQRPSSDPANNRRRFGISSSLNNNNQTHRSEVEINQHTTGAFDNEVVEQTYNGQSPEQSKNNNNTKEKNNVVERTIVGNPLIFQDYLNELRLKDKSIPPKVQLVKPIAQFIVLRWMLDKIKEIDPNNTSFNLNIFKRIFENISDSLQTDDWLITFLQGFKANISYNILRIAEKLKLKNIEIEQPGNPLVKISFDYIKEKTSKYYNQIYNKFIVSQEKIDEFKKFAQELVDDIENLDIEQVNEQNTEAIVETRPIIEEPAAVVNNRNLSENTSYRGAEISSSGQTTNEGHRNKILTGFKAEKEIKQEQNRVIVDGKVIHIKPDPSTEQNPPGSPRSL